ncbi:glutamine--fructose-6-phosphate transaminase (isomerizing) [Thermovibrio ammonificans]|uniref:Glutamine--fructose-6-phosphate aminotransferase [isomerizing] n=1 Tax=Thermovibrio ammonificans (strain DSM 15698 / JCM 12110 / HB-1) TaxID=648996 RepID=E8T6L0_THEA1|nr:glutamine--fructose-6-phosphate transaminase (isomerizing) [Thermovibrio ammonificans]ADU96794.1 glucosamine/fructose-6-phosphate aminotransferase, isomerizing [Thermovibrio ammonificans HB-1]
MCGIVGYTGDRIAEYVLIDGLKRLEYRGYDSAGIALIVDSRIQVFKKKGKIRELERELRPLNLRATTGIGHTRWATHGSPTDLNAHPHLSCDGRIALVHNGIIENYQELKRELAELGHTFRSETDSEVVVHLIEEELKREKVFKRAFLNALSRLKGSFALAVITTQEPTKIFVARKDSPLVIGLGEEENFVASDVPAFLAYTDRAIFLNDFEAAVIDRSSVEVFTFNGEPVKKEAVKIPWSLAQAEKGGYKHFMLKEINEQPRAIADTISGNLQWFESGKVEGIEPEEVERITVVACGTSYHAGLIGKFLFENLAKIPTEVDYASEFRYRDPIVKNRDLVISITQSGETADTLAAMRLAKERGAKVLTICNVIGSTATREADTVIYTYAGPEISVASTKAFTTQLTVLLLLALCFGRRRGKLGQREFDSLFKELMSIPSKAEAFLNREKEEERVKEIALKLYRAKNALYLGRHVNYPIALEGALKLKEISYIHAEGYPAGEMKHGPIALIDETVPAVFLATKSPVYEKVLSNIEEVKARKGRVVAVVNPGDSAVSKLADFKIEVPETHPLLSPVLNVIPLQLLAYYIADFLGYDVDQPRNLAKSVTVE